MVGAVLTGMFAKKALGRSVGDMNIGSQLGLQVFGDVVTLMYSGILTFTLVKVVDALVGICITDDKENTGLDIALHNELEFSL
ncbi:MAG: hypothetical protein VYE68_00220 [Acidobacteriota bacterium]|nr:hypothetical protein [Acidobacteriota bacterium]